MFTRELRGPLLLVMIATTAALTAPLTAALSSRSTQDVSWLLTSGTGIFDESGRPFNLYGVNMFYGEGQRITLADIQAVKGLGFNAFRVEAYWGLIQPYNETLDGIDAAYLTTGISTPFGHAYLPHPPLDTVVQLAVDEGMYVIICLETTPSYPPPRWAFPLMQNRSWGYDIQSEQEYSAMINGTAAKETTGLVNTWHYIADRYRDVPNVIFELLNEPQVSDTSLAGDDYKRFNEAMISGIETAETRQHLKLVEFLLDDSGEQILDGTEDLNESNVIWATHNYAPMASYDPNGNYWHENFTWHGKNFQTGWGNGTTYVAWSLIRLADKIHSWNKPWMSTEFSKNTTQPYWRDWFNTVLQTMSEYHIAGWIYFCYSSDPTKEVGWNIADSETQQMIMPALSPYLPESSPALNEGSFLLAFISAAVLLSIFLTFHYRKKNAR